MSSSLRHQVHLPAPALHPHPPLCERIPGVTEMKHFWLSGDPADLPVNPDVAVVMDWLNRMTDGKGFERQLTELALGHQMVMDEVLQPAEDGDFTPMGAAHPLELMQCLWRIGVQYERIGFDDLRRPIIEETFCAAGAFWRELRCKLIQSEDQPSVVFSTAKR